MMILYLILPLALGFAGAAVAAFAWTVRSGQLDDIETPPRRILFEDEPAEPPAAPGDTPAPPAHEMMREVCSVAPAGTGPRR
jgi:cbb3-type cytochrome oxidase maturation protein